MMEVGNFVAPIGRVINAQPTLLPVGAVLWREDLFNTLGHVFNPKVALEGVRLG